MADLARRAKSRTDFLLKPVDQVAPTGDDAFERGRSQSAAASTARSVIAGF
jgi:hypothetical protein